MQVKIRNAVTELTIEFNDSDLPFLTNWFNRVYDPITGKCNEKRDYVEDIYYRNSVLFDNGKLANCFVKEIDLDNKLFILCFDAYLKYDPIPERNKKINKIINRISNVNN